MINIRARFIRGEEVKYISHLDMMKMFERALRRSRIPIYYSQGFNPHPQIVFGLPLSVGVTSDAEYVDFELSDDMEPKQFVEALNKQMPEGLKLTEAKVRTTKSNIMASISKATYEVLVTIAQNPEIEEVRENILTFLENKEIFIKKESKGKVRNVDIRPMIHKFSAQNIGNKEISTEATKDVQDSTNIALLEYIDKLNGFNDLLINKEVNVYYGFSLLLSAGSMANLKPEFVLQSFGEAAGLDLNVLKVHRSGLFIDKGDKILNPLDNALLAI
ncbi:TIGR03936 family radical SAM-associated protein [Acetivibrio cellulolyticus]|uniref:TIGR03936 family radical SAM-associated protein n=1 Tax=Acetivibrio cellulolyticus TaxID=35830 RepID=UPI0001E2E78E|nr:TIGR03936 family radical SAM-associated protein [Acetivibrio cellulolyticus]